MRYFRRHGRHVIYEPLADIGGRADLAVDGTEGPT
jgi:hypothetical protein